MAAGCFPPGAPGRAGAPSAPAQDPLLSALSLSQPWAQVASFRGRSVLGSQSRLSPGVSRARGLTPFTDVSLARCIDLNIYGSGVRDADTPLVLLGSS